MTEATDVIRREHVSIANMISVLQEMGGAFALKHTLSTHDMLDTVHFFLRFGDTMHHAKEEQILFPALARVDADSQPLLDNLLAEHQHARVLLGKLEASFARQDWAAYFVIGGEHCQLLHEHLLRENSELLPLIDRLFSAEEQSRLALALVGVQEQFPAEEVTHWLQRQQELTRIYPRR